VGSIIAGLGATVIDAAILTYKPARAQKSANIAQFEVQAAPWLGKREGGVMMTGTF